jgi:hypothetical protein
LTSTNSRKNGQEIDLEGNYTNNNEGNKMSEVAVRIQAV